jgi:hypothetical protein
MYYWFVNLDPPILFIFKNTDFNWFILLAKSVTK